MSTESPLSRLLVFAVLATVAAIGWASLLEDPEVWRFGLVVVIAVGAGGVMIALGGAPLPVRLFSTALVGVGAAAGGLVAIGIPARELVPWGWEELAVSIDRGISALRGELDYPIVDPGGISTALLVATLPAMLALASVLGFRAGARDGSAVGSLLVLLACFAIPATARPAAAPALWGIVLLALACLWLWAPRVRSRRAPAAIALLGCAGAVAIPAATSLAQEEPPIDYTGWGLAAPPDGIDFGWDHAYGPIDWPRTGTPLFEVDANGPHYWRVSVLDEFYAYGWRRSADGGAPVPATSPGVEPDDRWVTEASFAVSGLESRLLVSPGEALGVDGVDGVEPDADGTLNSDLEPLADGDSYSVVAYAPDPGVREMRASSRRYPEALETYTQVSIPFVPAPLGTSQAIEPLTPASYQVPLWGSAAGGSAPAAAALADSRYRETAQLASRLTAGKRSAYGAVVAVQDHLRRSYRYDESPPVRTLPIPAFLFRDRIGYCQQFSGAMALMLRMSGIPARVASGFAPGTPVSGRDGTWEVTDLDAHSWVEVYFNRIGWVPFDPTPAAAPAESQSDGGGSGSAALGDGPGSDKALEGGFGGAAEDVAAAVPAGSEDAGTSWGSTILLVLTIPLVALALAAGARALGFRRLQPGSAVEAEVSELIPALRASGRSATSSLTLLELERRLRDGGRTATAGYVRDLREARYRGRGSAPPSLAERRAARRELAQRGGPLRYARLLIAMPPGGPSGSFGRSRPRRTR